jgi:lipopolysaccharide export system protein LptA
VQKIRLLILFILLPFAVFAQKKTKITLINSQHSTIDLKTNTSYLRKPVFKQDNAILSCDSAVFFESRNVFEAYNNVHINQADTVNIYSDRLTYDGNSKMAHLSSNVRLVDRESVLTTNVLDYNMATKVGTYVDGGKIVSKDVTLTSTNGYYFSNTRDAYFRYNVVVVTPEVTIKSDTLRYNTFSNWAYFYGPTNIKGKDDNLYTENGAYNTKSEYAYFGKKNLYTQGSKSMKGDSLYYDGIAGYGKAVRNIVFIDTTDKTVLHGQLGYYYKKDERTVVTKNAYIGMGTKDSVKVKDVLRPDTLWMGSDTLETQMVLRQTLTLIPRTVIKKDNEVGSEDVDSTGAKEKRVKVNQLPKSAAAAKVDKPEDSKAARKKKKELERMAKKGIKPDSIAVLADSLKQGQGGKIDSLLKKVPGLDSLAKGPPGKLDSLKAKVGAQVNALNKATGGQVNAVVGKAVAAASKAGASGGGKVDTAAGAKAVAAKAGVVGGKVDTSLAKTGKAVAAKLKPAKVLNPLDTVKSRIIKAYHNVRVYKSNLQAKSDSLFYTSADSTLRWYNSPIMWGEGSQQTGDTIYLQIKNNKLSAVEVLQTAFSVNVEKDSARFNQIKGKRMTGFFKDGKVNSMYVDGNAESIYFTRDEKGAYKEMNQTVSSRLKITFREGAIADLVTIRDAESAITPVGKLKDNVLLTGFIWKPELRPTSKRDITNPKAKKVVKAPAKGAVAKNGGAKAGVKVGAKAVGTTGLATETDSLLQAPDSTVDETAAPKANTTSPKASTTSTKENTTNKADSAATSIKVVPATLSRDSTRIVKPAAKKVVVKP